MDKWFFLVFSSSFGCGGFHHRSSDSISIFFASSSCCSTMDILRCPPFLLVPAPSPPSQPWTFMSSSGQHLSSSGWTVKLFTAGTCLPLESEVVFLQQSKLVSEKGSWLGLISNIWMYFVWKPVLSTLSSILLLRDSWQDSNVTQQKTKTSAERKNEQRGKEKKKKTPQWNPATENTSFSD